MNYDRTTQGYIDEKDNAALSKWLREIKDGLAKGEPLELTTTRDGKGGEMVSGARRASKLYYKAAFDKGFLQHHARSIDEIQFMREMGMLVSPNPKTSKIERISGCGDYISFNDSIIRKFNAWFKFCEKNHKPARAATICVFGDGFNFTQAAKAMRETGLMASDKTVKGLCILGLELYEQEAKKVDRDSE